MITTGFKSMGKKTISRKGAKKKKTKGAKA
jgi:hypothetical protein